MENRREIFPVAGLRPHGFGWPVAEVDFMRGDPWSDLDLPTRIGPIFTPSFDLVETPDRYTLRGDLPGLGLRDLDIDLTASTLTVAGERKPERVAGDAACHTLERSFGSFSRTFRLTGLRFGECLASMHNGVLTVEVPKSAGARPGPESPWH